MWPLPKEVLLHHFLRRSRGSPERPLHRGVHYHKNIDIDAGDGKLDGDGMDSIKIR
jgi:hypothetical protein